MTNFEELGTIGFWGLVLLGFFILMGLKGAGGMAVCLIVLTVLAGYFASKGG